MRTQYMKILYALAFAATACGCTKTLETGKADSGEISFIVANYVSSASTKATVVGSEYTLDDFGTYSYFSAGYDKPSEGNTAYMSNEEITKTDGVWKAGKTYSWPKAGSLDFVSYSPYSATSPWITYSPADGGTLTGTGVTVSDGTEDYMYSDMAADYNSNTDEVSDNKNNYVGVPTLFRHALARVQFNAKSNSAGDGQDYTSTSVVETVTGTTTTSTTTEGTPTQEDVDGVNVTTKIDVIHKTTVTSYKKTTTVTTVPGGRTWTINVKKITLGGLQVSGDVQFTLADYTPSTSGQIVGWNAPTWTFDSSKETEKDLNTSLATTPAVLASDKFTSLMATASDPYFSIIPQSLSDIVLNLEYDVVSSGERTETITTETWTVTLYTIITRTRKWETISGDLIEDSYSDEIKDSSIEENPVTSPVTTTTNSSTSSDPQSKTYTRPVSLDSQGGLTAWSMNKLYTYNLTLNADGKRINFDPATEKNWSGSDSTNINL